MREEKSVALDNIHGAPLTSIDKALALTPLLNLCRRTGNTSAILDEFVEELNDAEKLFSGIDSFSKKSQARLAYLISNLIAVRGSDDKGVDSATTVLSNVLKVSESMSASSSDFNSAIPMENGWWGFEASAVIVASVARNEFLQDQKERIIKETYESLNTLSSTLFELEGDGVMRSKNAISRVVATLMGDVLATNPQNSADLEECFSVFRKMSDDLRALFELAKDAN